MIHVLHLIDGLNVGGAEKLLCDLVQRLPRDRYRVSVGYSTPGPLVEVLQSQEVTLTHLPRLARVDPGLLWGMCRAIRRDPPHIVHTHLFKSDFHGRLAARLCGVPVVVSTLHLADAWAAHPIFGRLYGATARWADQLIAVSEEVRQHHLRYTHMAPEKILTIANGVDAKRFLDQELQGGLFRQALGIPAESPLVGIVGRLVPQKDHATFLNAAAQIVRLIPQTRFVVVGDGPLRDELEAQAQALGLDQAVTFCGVRPDIPAVMAALDVLVFSSRREGLPVALLEGMAAARPVVATAVDGISGVLRDGAAGLLTPPGDPAALADAVRRVLCDPSLSGRLGWAGHERVIATYGLDTMVRHTTQLYETLLARRGVGRALQPV